MDYAFANLAFTGEHPPRQHSSDDSSTKRREPAKPTDNAANSVERQEPRRVASSVYSRSVNHETASTYWCAEEPPANPMLTQHPTKAQPLPPPIGPRLVNPEARLMPAGEFSEEHAQIDDMIRDLALNDEQGEGSLHDVSTPMALTPKSAKNSRRDISDRSLKSLVPTKATLELLEHIVRVAWDGNLQERLCEVALAIHKDLRSCFHNTTVTYETANRATHIIGEINVTVDCWLGQMRALQECIGKINVRRDTPNFMELPKEVHGREIKKFRLMLSPIPTQMGAECNAKIAGLMYRLFYDEVRDPFQHEMNANPSPSTPERTIMSYFTQLGKQFVKAQMAAEHLHSSTLSCWEQWTAMSEEIAKQAALMQSNSPAAVAMRAKGAVARVFHRRLRRSSSKTNASRASSGPVEISQPIPRLQARPGSVRTTVVGIPAHPLDATGELDEDERQLIRERMVSAATTPRTPHFSPHIQAGSFSPHSHDDDLYVERTRRPSYERKRPSFVSMESDHPALRGHSIYEEAAAAPGGGYNATEDPFANFSSSPGQQATYDDDDTPEYYHRRPDAPSLSDQQQHADLFARPPPPPFSPEHHNNPRNAFSDDFDGRHHENYDDANTIADTAGGNNNRTRFFANYPRYAAAHQNRIAEKDEEEEGEEEEEEDYYLHNIHIRRHLSHRPHHQQQQQHRATSNPNAPPPLIQGGPYYDTLAAFGAAADHPDEKPDAALDPDRNEVWHRAMALRRLEEGGPPAEGGSAFAPTPAMREVQRDYERRQAELDAAAAAAAGLGGRGHKGKGRARQQQQVRRSGLHAGGGGQEGHESGGGGGRKAMQELRREVRRLEKEIDRARGLKGERAELMMKKKNRDNDSGGYYYGSSGSGSGSGGVGVGGPSSYGEGRADDAGAAAFSRQGREKMALRKSMSVAGPSGAAGSGYSDVQRQSAVRRSASVGYHSSTALSRSGSRQSGSNHAAAAAFGASRIRNRSSSGSGGVRSEHRQHQQVLSPVQQEYSGVFRDSEGLLIEGNMRDGYRYVDEEDYEAAADSYARLESAGYYSSSDGGDEHDGDECYGYADNNEGGGYGHRESLDPLFPSRDSPLDQLRQPRVPHEGEDPDLFGDVDQEMYATDEEEPWRRV
ncbi:hypothetical protein SLS58_002753 [Diplodia intermedia]|uniref:Uncharacterized protein n=1 Tax=Diplodia intermedia TaxID=856260 RepID=A0ABR3TYD3_9PEZI